MTTPSEKAELIADELQGTTDTLTEALERHEWEDMELNSEFTARLDAVVFLCECCGWWCEISEMTNDPDNDWQCDDCAPNIDD